MGHFGGCLFKRHALGGVSVFRVLYEFYGLNAI